MNFGFFIVLRLSQAGKEKIPKYEDVVFQAQNDMVSIHLIPSLRSTRRSNSSPAIISPPFASAFLSYDHRRDCTTSLSITLKRRHGGFHACGERSVSASASVVSNEGSEISERGLSNDELVLGLREIEEGCSKWNWRGYTINYLVQSSSSNSDNPSLLLVHGFGASIPHWRRNIPILAERYNVYAIDLLGFGASDKPIDFEYTTEAWAQLILDFLDEIVQKPTVLIGNSIGSLVCVIAASSGMSSSTSSLVNGLVLLNCAGGMNNKAIVDDWRIRLLSPLFLLIDFLLKQRKIASSIFNRVTQIENLRSVLLSVYGNKESVDDDLVQIIRKPAMEEGALEAFVSIVTGPAGPNPVQLMPGIDLPILLLWGDKDPFTPLDGPVGKYFLSLPSQRENIKLHVLEGVGHCPHDDRPELVHEKLLPWLAQLYAP
ncbi:2-hydroxy-6-oxo-2,4-heptadienoate hydrolase [Impatiens glandulifera]|uniref:2-hydroxy-6-oxo-2,4-heptadienoate hydrolase n=1 Tax=Impatiens glandulifera TaxID=253017 RepID=UPI001FB0DB26|nr:2-hydroxy-6-oxo-2,4-heptadienoate hydrolase [Impatiens glandulifera]